MTPVRKTVNQHIADITYLLDKIFDLKDQADDHIRGALTHASLTTVKDLLALEIDHYEHLQYSVKASDVF